MSWFFYEELLAEWINADGLEQLRYICTCPPIVIKWGLQALAYHRRDPTEICNHDIKAFAVMYTVAVREVALGREQPFPICWPTSTGTLGAVVYSTEFTHLERLQAATFSLTIKSQALA